MKQRILCAAALPLLPQNNSVIQIKRFILNLR